MEDREKMVGLIIPVVRGVSDENITASVLENDWVHPPKATVHASDETTGSSVQVFFYSDEGYATLDQGDDTADRFLQLLDDDIVVAGERYETVDEAADAAADYIRHVLRQE